MSFSFEIAGVGVTLQLDSQRIASQLHPVLAPFSVPAHGRHYALRCEVEGPPTVTVGPDGQRALPEVVRRAGVLEIRGDSYEARIDLAARSGVIRQRDERFPIDTVVKLLLAATLEESLLIHGVGFTLGETGALFTGPSGAGKSTLGGLVVEDGATLLSDELVVVEPSAGGWRMHGTPWNVGQPRSGPLQQVGILRFAPHHRLRDAAPGEVLRTLIGNVLLVEGSERERLAAFRKTSALLNAVRPVCLEFVREPGVLAEALAPV